MSECCLGPMCQASHREPPSAALKLPWGPRTDSPETVLPVIL